MGKTRRNPLTKEELKEVHEFRAKKKREYDELLKQLWKDQIEELRRIGHGDNNQEQGKSIHEE
jgi:hypothetical protein